ncbi:MAG: S-layer homology domain-containing protein [Oscillospiraceae bacterium]|nr:S-layer homology domain-containing protein [Oscillospiraceae bacterium]
MKTKITAALSLAIALIAAWVSPVLAAPAFSDISDSIYEEYIEYCAEHGFMSGHGDGTFRPNNGMTRFDVSNVISKYFKYRINHKFKDIPHMNIEDNAAILMYAHGYLEGYDDNTFKSSAMMTREMAAVMVKKICGLTLQSEEVLPHIDFDDEAAISHWAKDAVTIVSQYGIMVGDTDGNFKPKDAVTRGELCRILWDINEQEWKKLIPPAPDVINAIDLAELSDLTPEQASGTSLAPATLTVTPAAHFTADVDWADLTDDKIVTGVSVGTVTLTAETGYTFTGTNIDDADLEAIFTAGSPDVALVDKTGKTLIFTLSY